MAKRTFTKSPAALTQWSHIEGALLHWDGIDIAWYRKKGDKEDTRFHLTPSEVARYLVDSGWVEVTKPTVTDKDPFEEL